MALDVDAGGAGRRLVVADHQRVDAEAGVDQDEVRHHGEDEEDDDRHRDAAGPSLAEPDDRRVEPIAGGAVGQHQRNAARHAEHARE